MQVTEQGLPISGHANRTGRWHLLVLLLFAVALGCHQRASTWNPVPMISEELRLTFIDVGYVFASFNIAWTAGFLLMAVFIWREKSWLGYAVLGILGVLGALLTGASSGVGGLIVARGIAGLAYGGLLVGAYRIVGGWLPPESHGLATGLLFAATQSMRLLSPLITFEVIDVGWRWCSRAVAGLWFLWLCGFRCSANNRSATEVDWMITRRQAVRSVKKLWLRANPWNLSVKFASKILATVFFTKQMEIGFPLACS